MKNTTKKSDKSRYSTNLYSLRMVKEQTIDFTIEATDSPGKVHKFIQSFYRQKGYDREVFTVVALNTQLEVIGIHIAHIGSIRACITSVREVFKFAILSNADSIILAHNHPSGHGQPSKADIDITIKMAKAGKHMDIQVRDHIVITDSGYVSLIKYT